MVEEGTVYRRMNNVEEPRIAYPVYPVGQMLGVEQAREESRRYIAYLAIGAFLALLAVIVVVGWIVLKLPADDVLKVITATASVLSGVVGAVVGFYFRGED